MTFLRRSFLILFALILSGGKIFAANSEQRAFAAATAAFQAQMWNRAEMEFAQFAENFPDSTNASQAVLLQAQSEFQQKKFGDAINLLQVNQSRSENLEDQFVYWIGESEFAGSNFLAAADTFDSLAENFPSSPFATQSIVEAASAQAQLKNWPQVEALLEEANGAFQRAAQMSPANETVIRGQLLLAQARFEQNNFDGAAEILESINSKALAPQLDWQRADLFCRTKIAAGDFPAALASTTNLFQIAGRNDDWLAEATATRADLLAKMNRPDDAVAEYRENLKPGAPLESQRQAILKITEIYAAQKQFTNAEMALENFLTQFPNAPAADTALLTLGELHLKSYAANQSADELQQAQTQLDQFIGTFTNSPLIGKAFLDRGWCNWFAGKIPESLDDFKSASEKLPPSEDLAVAKFKLGDALFAQNNFAGARTNYGAVLTDFTNFPAMEKSLGARALYQNLRASLELNDAATAIRAMSQLLRQFPADESTPDAEMLYAEGLGDLGRPAAARETFQTFEQQWPDKLRPQVEFAIARTYEMERNWHDTIASYKNWLAEFPTNELRPRAAYALAWANFQAGDETNALALFTGFVAQFPTNLDFAPQAQWWIADYFYRVGDAFVAAETNYESVYQNWPSSDLAYPARLMAGRAAFGRGGYSDAIHHFQDIISDTNCPADVGAQARFVLGTTLMAADSDNAGNPLANFSHATNVFGQLIQLYPTNELSRRALIEIGKCDLQTGDFDSATNAYAAVFNSTNAGISMRSEAQIGFGLVLEKKAELAAGDDKKNLLQQALNNYLDVFEAAFGKNLRDGETADPFWVKKAGLQALPLIQSLGGAPPGNFIDEMESLLPQLKDSLEKKRAEFSQIKS